MPLAGPLPECLITEGPQVHAIPRQNPANLVTAQGTMLAPHDTSRAAIGQHPRACRSLAGPCRDGARP